MRCSIVKPKQQLHLLCYLHKPDYTNLPVYIPILGSLSKKKKTAVHGQLHMLLLIMFIDQSFHMVHICTWQAGSIFIQNQNTLQHSFTSRRSWYSTLWQPQVWSLVDQTIFLKSNYRYIFHVTIQMKCQPAHSCTKSSENCGTDRSEMLISTVF